MPGHDEKSRRRRFYGLDPEPELPPTSAPAPQEDGEERRRLYGLEGAQGSEPEIDQSVFRSFGVSEEEVARERQTARGAERLGEFGRAGKSYLSGLVGGFKRPLEFHPGATIDLLSAPGELGGAILGSRRPKEVFTDFPRALGRHQERPALERIPAEILGDPTTYLGLGSVGKGGAAALSRLRRFLPGAKGAAKEGVRMAPRTPIDFSPGPFELPKRPRFTAKDYEAQFPVGGAAPAARPLPQPPEEAGWWKNLLHRYLN